MALRQYREHRTSINTGTDVKGDAPHAVATQQLIPQITRRSRNAVAVDRVDFYFYQRKQAGRRCSCFAVEQAPAADCLICHGTGYVGGYDKFGCETDVVDYTRPGLRCINVEGNFDEKTRPVMFRLMERALYGVIEFDMEVRANVKMVDALQLQESRRDRRHSRVTAELYQCGAWVALTDAALSRALYGTSIRGRITMERDNLNVPSPLLTQLLMRYRKLDKPRVHADIPRRRRSVILEEFGVAPTAEMMNLFLADNPRSVSTEDIFIMCNEGSRWKVVDESENKPGGILTSHDVMVRLVQPYEPYSRIPI